MHGYDSRRATLDPSLTTPVGLSRCVQHSGRNGGFGGVGSATDTPAHPELLRLIDHGFDPEDHSAPIVHLDPVRLRAMFEPPTGHPTVEGPTDLLGKDRALELVAVD
jgi:hypothetical protein